MKKRSHSWFSRIMLHLFGMNPPPKTDALGTAFESDGVPQGEPIGAHTPPFNNTPDASTDGAPTGVTIDRQLRWGRGTRVEFNAPEIHAWPRKVVKKSVCGTLCADGEKIEWIGSGRQYSDFHNATVPGKYFKGFQAGQVIRVSLKDINGQNEIQLGTLVWR